MDVDAADAVLGMQWRRLAVGSRRRIRTELEECRLERRRLPG
ncbi:hypothetical protein [Motilibacter deserti]|nr:hypothetical protein [Motilibacter deserti]